VVFLRKTPQ
jgi:CRP-like cAMP-binding protein